MIDVKKRNNCRNARGEHAAQQKRTELVDRSRAACQLAGAVPPEEGRGQAHEPRHHRRLHRHRDLGLNPRHGELPRRREELGGNEDAQHKERGAPQNQAVPALQHEAGQGFGDVRNQNPDASYQKRQPDHHGEVRPIQAAFHIGEKVRYPDFLHRQRLVEADRLRGELLRRPTLCRDLFAVRVLPEVAAVLFRQKHHGQSAVLVKGHDRAEGGFIPILRESDWAIHESVGLQRVVKLILHRFHAAGDLHRLHAVVFQ